jgi:adenine phosphoribosyltransferase
VTSETAAPSTPAATPPAPTASSELKRLLTEIPDFPKPGILFRDVAPVFADGPAFRVIVDELVARFAGRFDAVAGVEARGFVLAAAAAYATGTGLLVVRKAGKLPGEVIAESYDLEYGTATLELEPNHLAPGARVLVLDDILATGGTLRAAARLIERAGYTVAGIGVLFELAELDGRAKLAGYDTEVLLAE